jgi:uncharacterized protein YceH (UPF0502 family)
MTQLLAKLKRLLIPLVMAVIAWFWITQTGLAQVNDIRLESRVDRLESELSRVRSQLTRLEAQVRAPDRAMPLPPADADLPGNELTLDEQFDNLATLAIELKQDLRQLETKVAELERLVRPDL